MGVRVPLRWTLIATLAQVRLPTTSTEPLHSALVSTIYLISVLNSQRKRATGCGYWWNLAPLANTASLTSNSGCWMATPGRLPRFVWFHPHDSDTLLCPHLESLLAIVNINYDAIVGTNACCEPKGYLRRFHQPCSPSPNTGARSTSIWRIECNSRAPERRHWRLKAAHTGQHTRVQIPTRMCMQTHTNSQPQVQKKPCVSGWGAIEATCARARAAL